MKVHRRIFFEPWGLGDALIAAAVLREDLEQSALACKAAWHPLLRAALPSAANLVAVEVPYTTRTRTSWVQLNSGTKQEVLPHAGDSQSLAILSIRGDFRDWLAARQLFPGAKIKMSGWIQFPPHFSTVLDAPFAWGILPIRNRYRAWAKLAGVEFSTLEKTYHTLQAQAPTGGPVVLHMGASQRSKQFPLARELRDRLVSRGLPLELLLGRGDPLPAGLTEAEVSRVQDQELIDALRRARLVISNDSGPMHLAALLGCPTLVIYRVTNIAEWIPPATAFIASPQTPRSYRIDPRYNTDEVLESWPSPESIMVKADELLAAKSG